MAIKAVIYNISNLIKFVIIALFKHSEIVKTAAGSIKAGKGGE